MNIAGRVVPAIGALATAPFVLHRLGTQRFGLLSLMLGVITSAGALDFGIGLATTKLAAEAVGGRRPGLVAPLVWSGVMVECGLGAAGAAVIIGAASLIAHTLLRVPAPLINEAERTLYVLAAALPFTLASGSFRGVLEAVQRFDLVNLVSVPVTTVMALAPAAGLLLGWGLPGILGIVLLARVLALASYSLLSVQIQPEVKSIRGPDKRALKSLLAFGGYVSAPNIFRPLTTSLDRIFLTRFSGLTSVAYYSAGQEILKRLAFITSSWATAVFPAFSTLSGGGDRVGAADLYERSLKFLIITTGTILALIVILAHDALYLWLGPDFATYGAMPLQILALGVWVAWVGYVPFTYLRASGYVDIPVKIEAALVPFEVLALYVLTRMFGLIGAALGAACGFIADPLLMFVFCYRVHGLPRHRALVNNTVLLAILTAGTIFGYGSYNCAGLPPVFKITILLVVLATVELSMWRFGLDGIERNYLNTTASNWIDRSLERARLTGRLSSRRSSCDQ